MNIEKYRKAVENIHAPEELKKTTIQRMRKTTKNERRTLRYIGIPAAACLLLFAGGYFVLHNSSSGIEPVPGRNTKIGDINTHTAKDEIAVEGKEMDVNSDTVQWFCSAYAIYTQFNKKDLGIVGGLGKENEHLIPSIRKALLIGWEIKNRESAIEGTDWLVSEGHRTKYRVLAAEMQEKGLLEMSEEELKKGTSASDIPLYRQIAISRAWRAFGEKGIDAWDYCRALQVLGDCYQAGYINLEECLDCSLVIAKTL